MESAVLKRVVDTIGSGVGVGVGLGLALGVVAVVRGDLRPVLRGALKGGVAVADFAGRSVAEMRETAEDLYHEAQAERAVERGARQAAAVASSNGRGRTVVLPKSS